MVDNNLKKIDLARYKYDVAKSPGFLKKEVSKKMQKARQNQFNVKIESIKNCPICNSNLKLICTPSPHKKFGKSVQWCWYCVNCDEGFRPCRNDKYPQIMIRSKWHCDECVRRRNEGYMVIFDEGEFSPGNPFVLRNKGDVIEIIE
jgi:hypothetical protein